MRLHPNHFLLFHPGPFLAQINAYSCPECHFSSHFSFFLFTQPISLEIIAKSPWTFYFLQKPPLSFLFPSLGIKFGLDMIIILFTLLLPLHPRVPERGPLIEPSDDVREDNIYVVRRLAIEQPVPHIRVHLKRLVRARSFLVQKLAHRFVRHPVLFAMEQYERQRDLFVKLQEQWMATQPKSTYVEIFLFKFDEEEGQWFYSLPH